MQIVRDLGGYSYGRSDLVRRAMSKKKMDVMLEEKEYFIHGKTDDDGNVEIAGCVRNGVPEDAAEEIFNQMVSFAEYAFNKSHAAAYAVLAYETGYLKVHYPAEFMAALMTSVTGDANSISKYMRNCQEMGIQVLPPDVNESDKKFSVTDGKIRFGLSGVKNVGDGVIDAIIEARETKGIPSDIFRFIENLDVHKINKKAIESLIKAGALDCFDPNRAAHIGIYESLIESAQSSAKKNIEGQLSLFQLAADTMEESNVVNRLPAVKNFEKSVLLAQEKEMLGVYLSGNAGFLPHMESSSCNHHFCIYATESLLSFQPIHATLSRAEAACFHQVPDPISFVHLIFISKYYFICIPLLLIPSTVIYVLSILSEIVNIDKYSLLFYNYLHSCTVDFCS